MDKKTPLYDTHVKYGGKIVPLVIFTQFSMRQVSQEHMQFVPACGLIRWVPHEEILVSGPSLLSIFNYVLIHDFTDLKVGQVKRRTK